MGVNLSLKICQEQYQAGLLKLTNRIK